MGVSALKKWGGHGPPGPPGSAAYVKPAERLELEVHYVHYAYVINGYVIVTEYCTTLLLHDTRIGSSTTSLW